MVRILSDQNVRGTSLLRGAGYLHTGFGHAYGNTFAPVEQHVLLSEQQRAAQTDEQNCDKYSDCVHDSPFPPKTPT